MRSVLALVIALSASSALALDVDTSRLADGTPVTSGALMQAAKVIAFFPQGEVSFASAEILTDDQIAALIPTGTATASDIPAIMEAAKTAVE